MCIATSSKWTEKIHICEVVGHQHPCLWSIERRVRQLQTRWEKLLYRQNLEISEAYTKSQVEQTPRKIRASYVKTIYKDGQKSGRCCAGIQFY